jgi:hypothetical protein
LIITPQDSTTEITVANADTSLLKAASYTLKDATYFDTSMTYNLLTNTPSVRPCFDQITYTIAAYPAGIAVGGSSGLIKAYAIPEGDAELK